MALSKRSFPFETVKDPATHDALRLIFDRIHDLEARPVPSTTAAPEDAINQDFADNRYQLKDRPNVLAQERAVTKLVALGLTEEEARSLL